MPGAVIDELVDKAAMFGNKEKYYFFFSKSGFADTAKAKANDNVKLIEFCDMFERPEESSDGVINGARLR